MGGISHRVDRPRRRLLKGLAAGALYASTASRLSLLRAAGAVATATPGRASDRVGGVSAERIRALATMLRTTREDRVFDATAERIAAGATHREILGATFLAAIEDVRPLPPGTKFHAALVVPSMLELAEAAGGDERWLPVFFGISVLKRSQERDVREGDWTLSPPPSPLTDDPAAARRALADSLRAWDDETADRAATAAARLLDLDDLFEILWPLGARDHWNIGHKAIHTAHTYRTLQMMDGHLREPAIRSLVYALSRRRSGRSTEAFDASRARIGEIPDDWEARDPDPEASRDLCRSLRTATPEQALEAVIDLLTRGVAAASIWDGIRLVSSEMLFRLAGSKVPNAQLLGVHPMTILNSLHFAWERTRREQTRRLLLLQAAAWTPLSRDVLRSSKKLSMEGPGIEGLEVPDGPATAGEAVQAAGSDRLRSAALVLQAARDRREGRRFIDACRSLVVRKAPEHHHHKYAVAAFEEYPRAHPRLAPYVLAPCLSYLPTPADEDSDVVARARAAIRKRRG